MDTQALRALKYFRKDRDRAVYAARYITAVFPEGNIYTEHARQKAEYTAWLYCRVLFAAIEMLCVFPPQSKEYKVLYHRYILGRSWDSVANTLHYSERQVKRIGKKALEVLKDR